jgi:hypothetical protein
MKRLSLIAALAITVAASFAGSMSAAGSSGSFLSIKPWPMVSSPAAAGYFITYDLSEQPSPVSAKVEIRVFKKAAVRGGWRLVHRETEMGRPSYSSRQGVVYDLYRREIRKPGLSIYGTYIIWFRLIDPATGLVTDVESQKFRLIKSSRFTIYVGTPYVPGPVDN